MEWYHLVSLIGINCILFMFGWSAGNKGFIATIKWLLKNKK